MENVSQSAWIEWSPPKGMAYCIESYLIEEQHSDHINKHEINTSPHRLNATSICSLKSINITPKSERISRWMTTTLILSHRASVQNLHVHPLSSTAINITWDPPEQQCEYVAYYSIYKRNFPNIRWTSHFSSKKIDDMIPCTNYSFVVVPVNRYGVNHLSAMASVSMPEQRIPRVQQVKSHHGQIQWNSPLQSYSCIKEFQVILRTTDNRLIVNTTISGKSKGRKSEPFTYHFRQNSDTLCALLKYSVTPVSLSGRLGDPYEITTPPPKPGPVLDVTINTSVERQVTISWMKPELFPNCVSSYRISYDDRNVTTNETSITIQNLYSCMEYNFTIATVDLSGEDAASVVTNATVKEEKLSAVQDLELTELDPRSLIARWKPPANGTHCVASYRYVAWVSGGGDLPEQISNSTTDIHITFVEVFACTKYYVQVIPVSKGNNDGNNEIADIVTKERVILRYHIDPVRIKTQMAQSLELQTALTSDNTNNCDLHAVRFTCTTSIVPEGEDPKVITGEAKITDLNATFSAVVTPLQPYNEYNCTAAILNTAGWSDETALAPFMTGEDFPEQPQNLQLRGDVRMIELSWKAPKVKNGIISRYRVHIRSEGARYPTPSYCPLPDPYNSTFDLHEDDENAKMKNWDVDELDHNISYLNPYTDYVVQVAAATKAGLGPYTEMVSVATLPEQPDPVYEFSEYNVTLPEIDKPYNSTVHISWKIPCHLHGRLRSFSGQFIGYKGAFEHTFGWTRTIDPSDEILETYSLTEERLEPELQYNVSIMVFVEDVGNHSNAKFLSFLSPAGIPNITNEINWGTVNVMNAPNPTRTARIWISDFIFQSNVGSITNVALLVSERHCQADPVPKRNLSIEWPDVLSWKVAAQMPCIPQYQTTPKQWNPIETRKRAGRQTAEVEYIIGKDHCEEDQEYCNGALKPGTEYALIVRIFTNSGYSDSTIQFFQTDSLIQLTVIVTSIFVCLLLAFALGLVILWRTQKLTVSPLTAVRSPNEEPADIPLKSFSGIYEELIQSNREKINKEYQAINFFSEQLINEKVTFFVAKENERKNRYLGIFPYDGNRVPLDVDDIFVEEDEESNDYINASFIDGYKYQREYIATQGPKKETCFDFWRMILQFEVESIVMLTQTVENDRIKCYQYFPRFNQTLYFREVSVKCTQELNMGFYQKRLFLVTRDNMSKVVFHYHFLTWPDHGCPSSSSDLIKFIKIIRSERKNLALPVVVHCSAGVGRTGTLIALDIILQRIQQEKKINIYDTVKQLRTQRVKMVQTSEQYAFLYHACLEYTTRNNRKKPKTSTEEISTSARSSPDTPSSVAPKNGRRPMINIKFPKYVHSGISNVKSYVPDDVESKT
ncbi:phosphatidylinositol phosphatase PTPRQ-like [Ochlerotatus camptorhynchus]|uniref:phosphatidylinositol phosphatase PTPRQ-like n=1 Tax=Ochlerotatus camptorhynchus TaxID=644619 RepID=UPI0031D3A05E